MCILLKLDYVKFGNSNLLFSKVKMEKPLAGSPRPIFGEGRVKLNKFVQFTSYMHWKNQMQKNQIFST